MFLAGAVGWPLPVGDASRSPFRVEETRKEPAEDVGSFFTVNSPGEILRTFGAITIGFWVRSDFRFSPVKRGGGGGVSPLPFLKMKY